MPAPDFEPQQQVPLAPRTTFELGGKAAWFSEVRSVEALLAALRWAQARGLPTSVLGGGSNLLVADAGYDGLVLAMRSRGRWLERTSTGVELRAAAGEDWDELVAFSVAQGLQGLECLSGIPGLVGASPVQNIGAYGQEVSQCLSWVELIDTRTLERARWTAAGCEFGYRDSMLKRSAGRYVVTEVAFSLKAGAPPAVRYQELERALPPAPGLGAVREAVLALRRGKSMLYSKDDPNHRSAGSFFTNPVVSEAQALEVASRAAARGLPAPPRWALTEGQVKLAAGWLIEQAGFQKGLRVGAVGLSSAHALALVAYGEASTSELLAFAAAIVGQVRERFGVTLEREPVLLQPGASAPG
jgi:UDP-N-acetylmuramate dehydrogenase